MRLNRVLAAAWLLLSAACAKQELTPATPATTATADASATGFPEGFETGTKTAYATGSITFGSGSWAGYAAVTGGTRI